MGAGVLRIDFDRAPEAALGGGGVAQALLGIAEAQPRPHVPRIHASSLAVGFGSLGEAALVERQVSAEDATDVAGVGRLQLRREDVAEPHYRVAVRGCLRFRLVDL